MQEETGNSLKYTESLIMELETPQQFFQDNWNNLEWIHQSDYSTEMLLGDIDLTEEDMESLNVKCGKDPLKKETTE